MDAATSGKGKKKKGNTRKSSNGRRIAMFKAHPAICIRNKDRRVRRSSHGAFGSVAELEAHRLAVEAKKEKKKGK